jgi:biopolymer transport protein ExbD
MAEVSTQSSDNAGGKVRAKKQSTKTDMTPMVDLAFLLLTFFLLTTTFMKPSVIPVTMPEPVEDPTLVPEPQLENALTFVWRKATNCTGGRAWIRPLR